MAFHHMWKKMEHTGWQKGICDLSIRCNHHEIKFPISFREGVNIYISGLLYACGPKYRMYLYIPPLLIKGDTLDMCWHSNAHFLIIACYREWLNDWRISWLPLTMLYVVRILLRIEQGEFPKHLQCIVVKLTFSFHNTIPPGFFTCLPTHTGVFRL